MMKLLILFALFGFTATAGVFQQQIYRAENEKIQPRKKEGGKADPQEINNFDGYLANVTVGTPPQTFIVSVEIGISEFWIPDYTCSTPKCSSSCRSAWACTAICSEECCNENATTTINTNDNSTIDDNCSGKNLLKSATSKTYVKNDAKNWAIQYEFGLCIGFQGEDTVTLGNLIVPKCTVGQVFEMPPGLANFEYDGLLGLGLSTEGKAAPVLYTAEQQKLLKQPIFTVFLNNTSQGFITYGGLDEKYCSPDVEYVNITSDIWYQFKMDSFSMGAENSSDGWEVISELNSKKILAPEAISTQLLQAAGASENGTIDCNATFEDLKLIINAKEYVIPSKYLILKNNNECMFAVGGRNTTNSNWILGEPFIRSYCNIYGFKDKTIGFAKAIAQFA